MYSMVRRVARSVFGPCFVNMQQHGPKTDRATRRPGFLAVR